MNETRFKVLLDRYLSDTLSTEEVPRFLSYLRQYENTGRLRQTIYKALHDNSFEGIADKTRTDIIFKKILQQAANVDKDSIAGERPVDIKHWQSRFNLFRLVAAAAVIFLIFSGAYYFLHQQKPTDAIASGKKVQQPLTGDVAPGGNKAVLKLADGTSVVLDDADTGMIARQGSMNVFKLNSGELAYHGTAGNKSAMLFNTVSTPRAGQYQVVLPDGSKVWLNAASSIRFPAAFVGQERNVELTGEAYFEIAHNKNMPFHVLVNNVKVEVLGTHFNIMSYENENAVNTTLLEGSVRVSPMFSAGEEEPGLKLSPGQQASRKKGSSVFNVREVDVESVVAWKNGIFQFNSDDIQTIMRQIERWYDIDVDYAGKIPEEHYSGTVGRDNNLLKVLRIFEESGLRFKIQGKKLTILQ